MNAHDQQLEAWRNQISESGALWARVIAENSETMKRLETTVTELTKSQRDLTKSQQELIITQKEFASSLIRIEEKRFDDNKRVSKIERQIEIMGEKVDAHKEMAAKEMMIYREHVGELKTKLDLLIEVKKDNKTIYIGVVTALLIAFLTWAVTTLKNAETGQIQKSTLSP